MTSHPRYELLNEIGRGHTAVVYRARDRQLERDVAIKEVQEAFRPDPREMKQFWEEAQFLAKFHHENLVQIYDVDQERGWIIMELLETGLDAKLAEGPLAPEMARSVLRQGLEALRVLHDQGKLHGAIKPANLLLDGHGRVKVSDPAGLSSTSGTFGGKQGHLSKYVAPELFNPDLGTIGPASDLYCLGFTVLELLAGPNFDLLFPGTEAVATNPTQAWRRWHGSPTEAPLVRELIPDPPPDLARVIDRLLKKPTRERYATAAEAIQDLEGRPRPVDQDVQGTISPGTLAPGTLRKTSRVVRTGDGGPIPSVRPQTQSAVRPGPATWKTGDPQPETVGGGSWYTGPILFVPLVALAVLAFLYFWFRPPADDGLVAVTIDSKPPNALVFINGVEQAQKAGHVFRLPPGDVHIRLDLPNHEKHQERIVVKQDSPNAKLVFTLKPAAVANVDRDKKDDKKDELVSVIIESSPPGATVFVNDKEQAGKTGRAFLLPVGEVRIRLELHEHTSHSEVVVIKSDSKKLPQFTLKRTAVVVKPPTRTINIVSKPAKATVFIDDKKQDGETNGLFNVPKGPFTLRLEFPGRPALVRRIDKPDTEQLKFDLPVRVAILTEPAEATIRLDGTDVQKTTPNFLELAPGKYQLELRRPGFVPYKETLDVALDPGEQTRMITLVPAVQGPYALLVGVARPSRSLPDFQHAEADVTELGRVLVASGYGGGRVRVLNEAPGGMDPTAATIRRELKELVNNVSPADSVIIALVGHIVTLPGQQGSYYCPMGANLTNTNTLISLAEVYETLDRCQTKHKVVILDGWRADVAKSGLSGKYVGQKRSLEPPPPPGVAVLAASPGDELGYEHPVHRHGLFCYWLLRGLRGAADGKAPDGKKDQAVSLGKLFTFVREKVEKESVANWSHKQQPHLIADDGQRAIKLLTVTPVLAHVEAGHAALDVQEPDKALVALFDAEKANPKYADLFTARATAHYYKAVNDFKYFDRGLDDCQKALEIDKRNAEVYDILADLLAEKAKHVEGDERDRLLREAKEAYDEAIRLAPTFALAHNYRGIFWAGQKKYTEAIADYSLAIQYNPRFHDAYQNRGQVHKKAKAPKQAIADFTIALQLKPKQAETFARRGQSYFDDKDFPTALQDLNEAVNLDKKDAYYRFWRARIYIKLQNYAPAIDDLNVALSNDKDEDRETLAARGFAHYKLATATNSEKNYEKAVEDLTRALKRYKEEHPQTFYLRGLARFQWARLAGKDKVKILDEALDDFRRALDGAPNFAEALFLQGTIRVTKGLKVQGEADIKKARALDPAVDKQLVPSRPPGLSLAVPRDRNDFVLLRSLIPALSMRLQALPLAA